MSCAGIPAYDVQRANFHKKMNEFTILLHFYAYFMASRIFGGFFGKLTKPCRHARTFQLVSQKRLADQLYVGLNAKRESVDDERDLVTLRIWSGSSAFLFLVKCFRNYLSL